MLRRSAHISAHISTVLLLHMPLIAAATVAAWSGSAAHARVQDDEVSTGRVERTSEIAAPKEKGLADRVIAEIGAGSIELVVDPNRDAPHIEAEFTIDGRDDKDVKRRTELVKLYAERAADQTIVVQPLFPGKPMARDSVRVRIVVPKSGEVTIRSTTGSISTAGTEGKMKLTTKGGAVTVKGHAGSLDVHAGDGEVEIEGARAEVRVSAGNGAVAVALADGNDLPFEIEARNGSVRVEVGAAFDGIVKMHTTSGSLDLKDPTKRSRLPQTTEHSKTVEIGAATGNSEIRTTTGSIRLSIRAK